MSEAMARLGEFIGALRGPEARAVMDDIVAVREEARDEGRRELRQRAERAEATLHVRSVQLAEMERSQAAGAERILELMASLQRAEADNAALLLFLREAADDLEDAGCPSHAVNPRAAADGAHPGAAMLERMRALEAIRDALVATQGQDRLCEDETTETLMSLVRAADALRVAP